MWTIDLVPRLRVGVSAINAMVDEVRLLGNRVALVCGRHLLGSGVAEQVAGNLKQAGLSATIIPGPRGEPTLREAAEMLEAARTSTCNVVVGMGGGSVLDVAKAIAGLCQAPGEAISLITDSLYNGPKAYSALPWVAVPTTAGTGSEATHVCVLSDPDRGIKQSMRLPSWYARAIIIDPELYQTAPPTVTAYSGMDALTQAIEAHTSLGANHITKALSLQAAVLLLQNLERAYLRGSDLAAREATAIGSCLAGIALTNARLGVVHGLAHPIGMRYQLAHGLSCAVLLPFAMRFNMPVAAAGYAEIAAAAELSSCGISGSCSGGEASGGQLLLEHIVNLNQRMGIPARLRPLGVQAVDIPQLAHAALLSGSTRANPRPVTFADLTAMLTAAL